MVATTTHSTHSLLDDLRRDYATIQFTEDTNFYWSASQQTVFFDPSAPEWQYFLLHELAHSQLDHHHYERDIQLLGLERDAWAYAADHLAPRYHLTIPDTVVQTNLDTYRDWLHDRSACPQCDATGIQTHAKQYKCLACHTVWRVNEARTCALRRHIVT